MKIISSIAECSNYPRICVALGNFDGVHLGHQQLVKAVVQKARQINGTPAIITFHPHPATVINPSKEHKMVVTQERKLQLFSDIGIEIVVQLTFTPEFSKLNAEDFFSLLVQNMDLFQVVIGFNYTFGSGGRGDWILLEKMCKQHQLLLQVIPPVELSEGLISSSSIRLSLINGDINLASKMLGRAPHIEGQVVQGNKIGRQLGFSTANLAIDPQLLLPKNGVYLTKVYHRDNSYFGLLNIGLRPTLNNESGLVAEVHLLDFDHYIYGEYLQVFMLTKLRDEQKFADLDQLVEQIRADEQEARNIIKQNAIYNLHSL